MFNNLVLVRRTIKDVMISVVFPGVQVHGPARKAIVQQQDGAPYITAFYSLLQGLCLNLFPRKYLGRCPTWPFRSRLAKP